jgi:hypothetical protein
MATPVRPPLAAAMVLVMPCGPFHEPFSVRAAMTSASYVA